MNGYVFAVTLSGSILEKGTRDPVLGGSLYLEAMGNTAIEEFVSADKALFTELELRLELCRNGQDPESPASLTI